MVTNFASNPVTNPLAFGLTYWSVLFLNRIVNIPLSGSFIFLLSGLLVVFSVPSFRKIGKMTFQKSEYDLVTSMLFFVLAFFFLLECT